MTARATWLLRGFTTTSAIAICHGHAHPGFHDLVRAEKDDAIAPSLPDERLLHGGAAFPHAPMPNIGRPSRTHG